MQKPQKNKEFWAEAEEERCIQCWRRSMSARRHRQKTGVFQSSEFCLYQESHWIHWGNLLWNAKKVSLVAWQHCQKPLCQSLLASCTLTKPTWWEHTYQGWKAVGSCSRKGDIKKEKFCPSFPALLCTGGNVAAVKIPAVSVFQLKVSDALHISSCWARCQGPSNPPHLQHQGPIVPQTSPPTNKSQNTWDSMHSLQPWTVSVGHLHPILTSAPLAILLCLLQLDGSTQQIHCNTALVLHYLEFSKKECYWAFNICQHNKGIRERRSN